MAIVDLAHLRNYGDVVVEQAVGPELVRSALDVVRDVVGIELDDPTTWRMDNFSPPVWAHQAQWEQHPKVYGAFAEVFGQAALHASQDGFGIKPPMAQYPGRAAAALPLHWDADRGTSGGIKGFSI